MRASTAKSCAVGACSGRARRPGSSGTPILHVGEFARGTGLFAPPAYRPSAELPDGEFPLVMMTGRVLAQYNACAMTGRTEGCNEIVGESFIEMNVADAAARGIADGDRVLVTSRRGSIARPVAKTNAGETWMPFHFQDGNANVLTSDALDPPIAPSVAKA